MKAVIFLKYGPPEVLTVADVDTPVPQDDQVLVKVHAASINPVDWHRMRGRPYLVRMMDGLTKPKNTGLGADLAGRVEAVGAKATQFRPGDEVFGMSTRTLAEYVRVAALGLAPKPANVTFEQAAAVPVAACTALQGLRDKGKIQPGQTVLINGAGGGVGTFAVQIARSFGAEVTGVTRTENIELVRSLGADDVIDYTREDFTQTGKRYDLIFDLAGTQPLSARRRALAPNGVLVLVGAVNTNGFRMLAGVLQATLASRFGNQKIVTFLTQRSRDDLISLKELIEAGKVAPIIDRQYPLNEIRAAMGYLETGHARGKVVIAI